VESDDVKWWETAEDHRMALIALQLPLRREILRFIGRGVRSEEQIASHFGLSPMAAKYHIDVLARASVVKAGEGGCTLTSVGLAYLEGGK